MDQMRGSSQLVAPAYRIRSNLTNEILDLLYPVPDACIARIRAKADHLISVSALERCRWLPVDRNRDQTGDQIDAFLDMLIRHAAVVVNIPHEQPDAAISYPRTSVDKPELSLDLLWFCYQMVLDLPSLEPVPCELLLAVVRAIFGEQGVVPILLDRWLEPLLAASSVLVLAIERIADVVVSPYPVFLAADQAEAKLPEIFLPVAIMAELPIRFFHVPSLSVDVLRFCTKMTSPGEAPEMPFDKSGIVKQQPAAQGDKEAQTRC